MRNDDKMQFFVCLIHTILSTMNEIDIYICKNVVYLMRFDLCSILIFLYLKYRLVGYQLLSDNACNSKHSKTAVIDFFCLH